METCYLRSRFTNGNESSQATMTAHTTTTNMAAPGGNGPAPSPSLTLSSVSPMVEGDNLKVLFLECVRGYIARAGSEVNWPLVARSTAAMILLLRRRRQPCREWVRFLLRSRDTFGEYHHLVRDMRLDNGQDFFMYFRMTRQR